ncbi:MAG: leucine-rich repeat protein, partial [Oscillospiraceae bacterium]|nr:leucine-rich repeat protein [Oscillospiraceae bacterium]
GYVLKVSGELTITDSSATSQDPGGDGKIKGGNNLATETGDSGGNGGGLYVYGGSVTMESGSIEENVAYGGGGSVYLANNGTFTLNQGYLANSLAHNGGGVYIESGTLTMNGGSITGNAAHFGSGGGVYMEGGSFVMNEGNLGSNYIGDWGFTGLSSTGTSNGGGVYVGGGTLTLNYGVIAYNGINTYTGLTTAHGGGVYVASGGTIRFGAPARPTDSLSIQSNLNELVNRENDDHYDDLYLPKGKTIQFIGAAGQADDPRVAVTLASDYGSGAFTSGWKTNMGTADPTAFFICNDPNRSILLSGDEVAVASPWALLQSKLSAGGSVELTKDVTADESDVALVIPEGKTVTLDLAGHTISRGISGFEQPGEPATDPDKAKEDGYVIKILGTLAIIDSSVSQDPPYGSGMIRGGNNTGYGGGVYVAGGGALTLNSGSICENISYSGGGGVYVALNGTFTMSGGSVATNYSKYGAGVYVGGAFTMTGGIIADCGCERGYGAGVYITSGNFKLSGGSITANAIGSFGLTVDTPSSDFKGGGVYQTSGTFTITSGSIQSNIINLDGSAAGAGVYVNGGTFSLGGTSASETKKITISGNSDTSGSNLYLAAGTTVKIAGEFPEQDEFSRSNICLTLASDHRGGAFTDGWSSSGIDDPASVFSCDDSSCSIQSSGGEAVLAYKVDDWTGLKTALGSGCNAVLDANITAEPGELLEIASNAVCVLDLNGHYILGNDKESDKSKRTVLAEVFGKLTLEDSGDGTATHYGYWQTDDTRTEGEKRYYVLTDTQPGSGTDYDTFTGGVMAGGSGITNSGTGGGVCVKNGTFTINGGSIAGCSAGGNDCSGGAIYASNATLIMNGGRIVNNSACKDGGGICVDGGAFTMNGGTISGNSSLKASPDGLGGNGGGVSVYSDSNGLNGVFTMNGGTISGNTADNGGGVWIGASSTFRVSGTPTVTGNTVSSKASNICLVSGDDAKAVVTIYGGLTDGAAFGVTAAAGGFTSGWSEKMPSSASPSSFFTSDSDDFIIVLSGSEAALLEIPETPSATFEATGADSGTLTSLVANASYTISGAGLSASSVTADANGAYSIDSGLTKGTLSIKKNGNGSTTNDSDAQTITVGKAATPSLTVTQPSVINGKGTVATTTAHEYSADDGASWKDCEENQMFAVGSYLIRVKADGTTLASGAQSVTISEYDPTKEATPSATFTAAGPDSGTLTNLVANASYTISGAGLSETTVTADANGAYTIASGLAKGTLSLRKNGNGSTTNDSDPQSISVDKAAKPSLTVTQPGVINGKGTVATTTAHEYSADDGATWTDCEKDQTLAAGSYLIRVKANGTTLASDTQSVTISEYDPSKEATPTATFTATGYDTGTLSGVTSGMKYQIGNGEWKDIESSDDIELTGLVPCTISVVKKGDGLTRNDSDPQKIDVTRAKTPSGLGKTDCTTFENNDGTISGVTTAMEYKMSDGEWAAVNGAAVTDLTPGAYYIRVRANGATLASDAQSVTIGEYDPSATVIDSGSCGDGVVWELRSDGTLFVTGSGKMADYAAGTAPWYKYRDLIETVELETGVTHVGSYAFYACGAIRHVSFCGSDVSIGKYAFAYCIALESTSIGNRVSSIDTAGFYACFRLGSLRPEAPSIGARAFELCGIDK